MDDVRQMQTGTFEFTLIAETGHRFGDFTPYVASVNGAGVVAFQAALRTGGSGVFVGDGRSVSTVVHTVDGPLGGIFSHPDINERGEVCFYACLKAGGQRVFIVRDGTLAIIPTDGCEFQSIGPLGPTMNDHGTLAFRASLVGYAGVFSGSREAVVAIADNRGKFSAFHGLPVINGKGTVVFRADLSRGGQGIYAGSGGSLTVIAETGEQFRDLSKFPTLNDEDMVVFAGNLSSGGAGIFAATARGVTPLVAADGMFESYRGALANNSGLVAFCATPRRGRLGVFSGPDPVANRIICIGDSLFGSTVTDFALNPVSVNESAQMAIRVSLSDNRQVILRIDPLR